MEGETGVSLSVCGENEVWMWRVEVCGASEGCVLGSRGGEMGR